VRFLSSAAQRLSGSQNKRSNSLRHRVKSLLRIFELSKNEQRVVVIIILALVVGAFAGYERRIRHDSAQPSAQTAPQPSPTPPTSSHFTR
jgi:ABC-type anion transport system duplicated permease subunit